MPSRQTVHQWRMRMPAFADQYARAREIGMESMADDILTIADDDTGDRLQDGSANHANVGRARLMVDTRKFLMAKLAPRIYGDKVQHEHSGTVEHGVTLSDRERMRRLASFMAQDAAAGLVVDGEAVEVDGLQPSPALPDPLPALSDDDGQRAIDEPRARDDDL